MKDIVDLKITQIRIYPIDVLPITTLLLQKNAVPFKETLRFKTASALGVRPEGVILDCVGGEFEHQGKVHPVERLTIGPQRIMFAVFGTSAIADAFYEEIRKIITAADPNGLFAKAEPHVKVEETSCVVTLDVNFRKLFAPQFLKFLEKTVRSQTSTDLAISEVVPSNFSARIAYDVTNTDLKKAGVRLMDKKLTIEPRARTSLKECRYYTLSPTNSETHLALLKELEMAFKVGTKLAAK